MGTLVNRQQPGGVPPEKVRPGGNMPSFGSRAHSIIQISSLLVACALAAVQTSSAGYVGGTQATYTFTGQCTDCSGTGIGQLVVKDYTLGATLTNSNLVSFTYTSNLLNFTITPSGSYSYSLTGTLPASLPATAAVGIYAYGAGASPNQMLISRLSGSWCAGTGCLADTGSSSSWSPQSVTGSPGPTTVPTLSPAVLGALGLLLAGAGALLAGRAWAGSAN